MDIRFSQWFPVASISDLPFRHVFQAQLLGREYAVWRADDGYVNIWENRCLHRGVRLSIGINEGSELKCQYHGWRYANRTAGCTYIPAHPADAPSRTICNNTYQSQEKYGMIWDDPGIIIHQILTMTTTLHQAWRVRHSNIAVGCFPIASRASFPLLTAIPCRTV